MKKVNALILTLVTLLGACTTTNKTASVANNDLANSQHSIKRFSVTPTLETRPLPKDGPRGFDADDPAIWVNPEDGRLSLVAATLKRGGMDIYDMQGQLVQHIPAKLAPACEVETKSQACPNVGGRWNNVDVIYDFDINGEQHDLFVVSDRGTDTIDIFKIDYAAYQGGAAPIQDITSGRNTPPIFTQSQADLNNGDTAYGLAAVKLDSTHVFVTQNNQPVVAELILQAEDNGEVGYRIARHMAFPSKFLLPDHTVWQACTDNDDEYPHFEGIVADIQHNALYLAQEDIGLWRVALDQPGDVAQWSLFARVNDYGKPYTRTWSDSEEEYLCDPVTDVKTQLGSTYLHADVEGLTMYDAGNGDGYLAVSSQGNNSVVLFERATLNPVAVFNVVAGVIDGVMETDGMMISEANLGSIFAQGVLIMQDGENQDSETQPSTNFKYVDWKTIADQL